MSLMSPALAGGFFTTSATWETSLDQGLTGSVWPTGHTFVAAVSLQFSGAHSLMDHLWQLLHYNSKAESLQPKLHSLQNLNYLLFDSLQKKFADPCSGP